MCELCGRIIKTTRHHLIPRSRKRRHRETFGPVADLCLDCHRKCHATFSNSVLARSLNTVEKLKATPELQSYIKWIGKQPSTIYFGSKEVND